MNENHITNALHDSSRIDPNATRSTTARRRHPRPALLAALGVLGIALGVTALPASAQEEGAKNRSHSLSLFQHDTSRQSLDVGDPGLSVGDQLVTGGDLFNHAGGTLVGRSAAHCVFSSGAEILCSGSLSVGNGQITFSGLVNAFTFFTNHPVDFAITGGTGSYSKARGTATILILPNVPDGTDALVTVDLD
ncbi:MAG TPA: hypothetical protein VGS22_23140 [Thermoanaerobaculia bacterium]|jgi:hypothetical protein|nr:hypothetical protein [Thermoanaerobaculia bacterium]